MNKVASRNDPKPGIRLPKTLLDRLDEQARANGRSRNSEILIRLQRSIDGDAAKQTAL